MTLTTWPVFTVMNGLTWFRIVYDSPMWAGDPEVMGDPNATYLVHAVIYQNLSSRTANMDVQGRIYSVPPGTTETRINIPTGQRFRLDETNIYARIWMSG